MMSNLWESRNRTKNTKGLRRSKMFFDPQPWPVYIAREGEKINFAGGVKLKSDAEMGNYGKEGCGFPDGHLMSKQEEGVHTF